ncbi:MAG: hypothetical protein WA057_04385 [Candidatus Magasanikiibacteriota bacterium]
MKQKKAYIGVTGFMSSQEITDTLRGIDYKKTDRLIMVGVLASFKTLQGIANKWVNRYPLVNEIAGIFQPNENFLNLIHFNTKELNTFFAQLIQINDLAGDSFNGFQLNIAWPDPKVLEKYKRLCPDKNIVLQIGGGAFEKISHSPVKLAEKINNEYAGLIDYVLLDPSGGTGKQFDPIVARGYLEELSKHENDFGLGVAGGLSSSTLNLIEPLVKDFPNISIDAEGKLRTSEDHLDVNEAGSYIKKSLDLFSISVI